MMKHTLLMLALASTSIIALAESPYDKFPADKSITTNSNIIWKSATNVQAACHAESLRRNLGGFHHAVEACSFWSKDECTIITAKNVTYWAVGHEVRHCFQGEFHK